MTKYYRPDLYRRFICGTLALLLMVTGGFAIAAPQNRNVGQDRYLKNDKVYFQEKRSPDKERLRKSQVKQDNARRNFYRDQKKNQSDKNSLIKPSPRRDFDRSQTYRQNTARQAMKSGRIVSLAVIRARVRQSFPGKIVDVRLLEPKNNKRSYMYKVKVLRKDGKLLEVKINAADARVVGVKGNK